MKTLLLILEMSNKLFLSVLTQFLTFIKIGERLPWRCSRQSTESLRQAFAAHQQSTGLISETAPSPYLNVED